MNNIKNTLNNFYNLLKSDKDYDNLLRDLVKYTTFIIVINLLFYISKPNTVFFNSLFLDLEMFMIVAISTYWLIIKKLITF
tara:strand:- start:92 stop:334 length:243 start_codon:yes stop_codon:yes gene_type:complete